MADREAPYDPYIPAGGTANNNAPSGQQGGNQRTAALQAVGFSHLPCYIKAWDHTGVKRNLCSDTPPFPSLSRSGV